ncbi:unnamed protein product, partial [Ectocarpus sp. 6 AP-2014]
GERWHGAEQRPFCGCDDDDSRSVCRAYSSKTIFLYINCGAVGRLLPCASQSVVVVVVFNHTA